MSTKIERLWASRSYLATDSAGSSERVPFGAACGGSVFLEAPISIEISWYAATESDGTPVALTDGSGSAVTTTLAGPAAAPIPDACFGCPFLLPVLASGSATLKISVKG